MRWLVRGSARSRLRGWIAAWQAARPPRTVEEIEADPDLAWLNAQPEVRGPEELEPWHEFRRFRYQVWVLETAWRCFTVHVAAAGWYVADPASLPSLLRENVETFGRAALQEQLDHNSYPRRIFVDRSGVRIEGRQVVFSPFPWIFCIAIGAAVGYGWTWIFGGVIPLDPLLGAFVFGLVPAFFHESLGLRYPLIMQAGGSSFNDVSLWHLAWEEISAWLRARGTASNRS